MTSHLLYHFCSLGAMHPYGTHGTCLKAKEVTDILNEPNFLACGCIVYLKVTGSCDASTDHRSNPRFAWTFT